MVFEEAESKLDELKAQQKVHEPLTQEEFEEQVRELMLQDERGVWWAIHPDSREWFYHDGADWVPGNPPKAGGSHVQQQNHSVAGGALPQSRRTRLAGSSAGKNYARAVANQPAQSRFPSFAESKFVILAFVIGFVVLLFGIVIAYAVGGSAMQALSASPTKTRAPLVGLSTATPLPTAVRLPTPIAPPATPLPVIARVMQVRVNVRVAPSLQAQVATTIPKNQRVTIIAKSEDGQWYQVMYQSGAKPGWMFGETLEIIEGNAQSLAVVNP